jgi:hypothetical protein
LFAAGRGWLAAARLDLAANLRAIEQPVRAATTFASTFIFGARGQTLALVRAAASHQIQKQSRSAH